MRSMDEAAPTTDGLGCVDHSCTLMHTLFLFPSIPLESTYHSIALDIFPRISASFCSSKAELRKHMLPAGRLRWCPLTSRGRTGVASLPRPAPASLKQRTFRVQHSGIRYSLYTLYWSELPGSSLTLECLSADHP